MGLRPTKYCLWWILQ